MWQFHQTPELKEKAKSLGIEHLDFDGCSEIWVEKWEDWEKFNASAEYARLLGPDCSHFMAMPIRVSVGYENVIYGPALQGMGKDGVTAENVQFRARL